jgi:putative membrane protein
VKFTGTKINRPGTKINRRWSGAVLGGAVLGVALGIGAAAGNATPVAADEDGRFLSTAAAVTGQQVVAAEAVASSARENALKTTARSIAASQQQTGQRLAALARQKGLPLHNGAAPPSAAPASALLTGQEEAVALFHRESVRGMDPEIKEFARNSLPALQQTLDALRALQSTHPEAMTS